MKKSKSTELLETLLVPQVLVTPTLPILLDPVESVHLHLLVLPLLALHLVLHLELMAMVNKATLPPTPPTPHSQLPPPPMYNNPPQPQPMSINLPLIPLPMSMVQTTEDIPPIMLLATPPTLPQLLSNNPKLLTPLSTLVKKSSRVKAESNTFLSKRKSLNTERNLELRESQRLEKSLNTEKKLELRKFPEKSPLLTIMPLNI